MIRVSLSEPLTMIRLEPFARCKCWSEELPGDASEELMGTNLWVSLNADEEP
jgi:hypothetical protein